MMVRDVRYPVRSVHCSLAFVQALDNIKKMQAFCFQGFFTVLSSCKVLKILELSGLWVSFKPNDRSATKQTSCGLAQAGWFFPLSGLLLVHLDPIVKLTMVREKSHPKDEEIHIQQSPRTVNCFFGAWLYNLRLSLGV